MARDGPPPPPAAGRLAAPRDRAGGTRLPKRPAAAAARSSAEDEDDDAVENAWTAICHSFQPFGQVVLSSGLLDQWAAALTAAGVDIELLDPGVLAGLVQLFSDRPQYLQALLVYRDWGLSARTAVQTPTASTVASPEPQSPS